MDILGLLLIIVFTIRTIRNTIYHLFWWQMKEYRLDRMLIHLRETYQGRRWCFGYFSTIKWILLGGYLLGKTSPFWLKDITILPAFAKATAGGRYYDITIFCFWGVFFIYLVETVFNLKELKGGWKVPQIRLKVILLCFAALSVEIGVISLISRIGPVSLIVLDKLLGPIVAGLVLGTNIPFAVYKKWIIRKARRKVKEVKDLRVVGVTGSYGKTTTKEFMAQILSKKFRVLKTAGSQNTDIGVAELILRSDLENYDIFVCEMAAYHRGEIREICEMVKAKLQMGVITGINEQHQSLFGSLEKTTQTKFELVEALPKDGLAIFNGKNKYCQKMAEWARRRGLKVRVVREMGEMKGVKSDITILPAFAKATAGGRYCDIEERKEGLNFFRENLALALAVAREFGMSKEEIRRAVKELKLPLQTMNVIKKGRLILIDDTFNANPDGVLAGLKFLEGFKGDEGRRVLVLQPLIELGRYAEAVHEKIGEKVAQVCQEIILTNRNFYQAFMKGAKRAKRDKRVRVAERLPEIKKGVILFEGKEAEKYLKTLS